MSGKDITQFYKDILESLKFSVTPDGYVLTNYEDETKSYIINGLPVVIPNNKQIELLLENDEGKINVTRFLYNPLYENALKSSNPSISRTKTIIEYRLSHTLYITTLMLLKLAKNEDLHKKVNVKVAKFLANLFSLVKKSSDNAIDDKLISNWTMLYNKYLEQAKSFITITIKKAGKIDGKLHNKVAILNSSLYESLLETSKDTNLIGVRLRNKDISIFKYIITYLLDINEENKNIIIGSNDIESPGFISLFTLFIETYNKISETLENIKFVDNELYDDGVLDIKVTKEEVIMSGITYKDSVASIPNETNNNSKVNLSNRIPNVVNDKYDNLFKNNNADNNGSSSDIKQAVLKSIGYNPIPNNFNQPMFNNSYQPIPNNSYQPMLNNFNQPIPNSLYQPMLNNFNQPMLNNFNQPIPNNFNQPIPNNFNQPMFNSFNQPMPNNFSQPIPNNFNQPMFNNFNQTMPNNYRFN